MRQRRSPNKARPLSGVTFGVVQRGGDLIESTVVYSFGTGGDGRANRCPITVGSMDELYERLESIAAQMNSLRRSCFARVNYDMMADALWWTDERPDFSATEDHWCLRPVFRYRTALIVGVSADKWLRFWIRAQQLFPNWPGFHRSRTSPNTKLAAFYNRQSQSSIDSYIDGFDEPEFREELRRNVGD